MSLKLRLSVAIVTVGALSAAGSLLLQSHAAARTNRLTYAHLANIQKRIISETLASAIGPRSQGLKPHLAPSDQGGGPDGAPFTPPASFGSPGGTGSPTNYFPTHKGQCSQALGQDVKVNQNCLNLSDPTLQGRAQANNEPSIAVNPFNSQDLVASDNNYIRGDGTCGSHFSLNGGRTWSDTTIPNGFTIGPPGFAREYWQGGGDTSVAWDTRGNAYESCQIFNRGTVASPNPDDSSAFVVFRATQNNGASWNFPGRYSTVFFDPTGATGGAVLEDKALMAIDDNVHSAFRDRIYVTWTVFAADGSAYIYEVHSNDYGESFSNPVLVSASYSTCTVTYGLGTPQGPCNENQFSDPFIGPDGSLYVAYDNFNNQPQTGNENHFQVLLAKSTDGGQTFSAPVKVSDYYELPDCDAAQGDNADPFRSCVPEKGPSTKSVFRATNYPSGAVDPQNPNVVTVTFGSYINADSNESNGCAPAGLAPDGGPALHRGEDAGRVRQQDPPEGLQGRGRDVRRLDRSAYRGDRHGLAGPAAHRPVLAVERVHALGQAGRRLLRPSVRQRRDDRLVGLQPVRQPGSGQLRADSPDLELDAGSDPVPGDGGRPVLRRLRLALGVGQGLRDLVRHP